MKKTISILLLFTFIHSLLIGTDMFGAWADDKKEKVSEIKIDLDAIHPRYRNRAFPQNNQEVALNPVALLWEAVKDKNVKYSVQLSQDSVFSKTNTIRESNLPWAMYNTHRQLEQGKWYWKYQASVEGKEVHRSNTYSFIVNENIHTLATPTVNEFVGLVESNEHPRMFVTNDVIDEFRKRNKNTSDARQILKRADKNINQALIEEAPTRPSDTTGVVGFEKDVMIRFMYHQFGEVVRRPIEDQSLAYLLTGDSKYAKEAVRQALHIAKMDPEGFATREDFNRASAMLAMATAFDVGYNYMTIAQKQELIDAIKVRGDYFFRHYANDFETHSMDNHVWQHTLRRLFQTSIAMSEHIEDADKWLAYTYEVWCSRFPILGGEDGGWHDGNSYYGVNFETFIMMPLMLKNLTGVDFFDLPWYKNAGDYLIYSYPKDSYSTGFGDDFEFQNKPNKRYVAYADALARETGDSHARAYADNIVDGDINKLAEDRSFVLYRLLTDRKPSDVKAKDINDLPQAKLFKDAGFALMHTDLANTPNNLMASFFGVPFGSTGHAHAAHNGFNVSYGGKQLFGGSGYYSNFNDPHTLMHYRTRGHNTLLVDGMAQVIGENGYGWIPRFANTSKLSYALGDAWRAYGAMTSEFWLDRMEKSNVEYTHKNGFGDPKLKRFRRHFTLLRPNLIVIYDELEAQHEVSWTWLLHSQNEMLLKDDVVFSQNMNAKAQVFLYANDKLNMTITDKYFSPAINWKQRKENDKVTEYKNNWHLESETKNKHNKFRFLAIIKINDAGELEMTKPQIEKGAITIGDWTIKAELDASEKASIEIINSQGDGISYNSDKYKGSIDGSTLIFEEKKCVEELIDTTPFLS